MEEFDGEKAARVWERVLKREDLAPLEPRKTDLTPLVLSAQELAGFYHAAARQLGWDQITATTVDVDDHQAARIVAADNRTADLGHYDDAALIGLLQELPDLTGTGYTDDDLTDLLDLAEGPPSLDELADEYGDPKDDDTNVMLRLSVPPIVATQWDEHRAGWDTDGEALEALLDR